MIDKIGVERRELLGLNNNDDLFNPRKNFEAAKFIFDQQGFAHGVLIEMDRITTIFLCYSWWGLSQELQRYILGAYFCTCCIKCNRWSELWRVCGVLLWWMKYHQSSFQVDFAKKVWWQEICSSDGSSNPGMNCLDQVIREESPMTSHSHCFLITQMNFKSQAKKLQPSIVLWRKTDIFLLKQREDLTRLMRFRDVLIQK